MPRIAKGTIKVHNVIATAGVAMSRPTIQWGLVSAATFNPSGPNFGLTATAVTVTLNSFGGLCQIYHTYTGSSANGPDGVPVQWSAGSNELQAAQLAGRKLMHSWHPDPAKMIARSAATIAALDAYLADWPLVEIVSICNHEPKVGSGSGGFTWSSGPTGNWQQHFALLGERIAIANQNRPPAAQIKLAAVLVGSNLPQGTASTWLDPLYQDPNIYYLGFDCYNTRPQGIAAANDELLLAQSYCQARNNKRWIVPEYNVRTDITTWTDNNLKEVYRFDSDAMDGMTLPPDYVCLYDNDGSWPNNLTQRSGSFPGSIAYVKTLLGRTSVTGWVGSKRGKQTAPAMTGGNSSTGTNIFGTATITPPAHLTPSPTLVPSGSLVPS